MYAQFECLLLILPLLTTLATSTRFHSRPEFSHQELLMDDDQGQTISDVIGGNEDIAIFTGFTRDVSSVSARFESTSKNVTVLAPQDSAIKALPRKPWEDLKDYSAFGANAYDGQSGVDRAQQNLQRFVEAHVVGKSPWKEHEKVETLGGDTVWYESREGVKYVQPGNIEVLHVADKVTNGEVWVLKGVRNYAA
ncbi:hypothetical protein EJ08DRAFT_644838 [Tothia fuscella]|uniref:FAS1 domain-containing protein n=1 Tax=Tothia fuscella TaxID=1048955 RepID=A0A9P4P415_9PEZI|nr:hypothetical protein EJ08DRAFT_644838 [Tothia fuscella]